MREAELVGPFFYIRGCLIMSGIPLSSARLQADKLDNPMGHEELFDTLKLKGDYIDYPRGRVIWDCTNRRGIIYIDPCIKDRAEEIARKFHLQECVMEEDEHYHCKSCSGGVMDEWNQWRNGKVKTPVFTGLDALDELTGGFNPGELIVLGGRPGMGKTSFALTMLEKTGIENGESCLIWSLEESKDKLVRRLYALHSGYYHALNHKKAEIDLFCKQYIENGPVWIDDTISGDLGYITNRWEEFKRTYNLRCIIVDYMQLISSPAGSHLCLRCLKSCAQRLSIPIIVLSQLNQIPESRTDKRPILSDLRWIDCVDPIDQVLFLYREDYYYRDVEKPNVAEFILAKHPKGKTGTAEVRFRQTPVCIAYNNTEV